MLQFKFNLLTFLLGIASGVIGQWLYNKLFEKKPPEPIFALIPGEAGRINVTSRLGPDYEFTFSSPQGTFTYTRPQTDTTDTANLD